MNNDLLLYQRFQQGENEALDELIKMYRNPLTLFINGFVKDIDIAESLMIDAFVELIRHKGSFKGESSLKTYLFTIGRNKALRHLKKKKNYDFVPLDEIENFVSSEQSLEDEIIDKMRSETVREAISKLNPAYREIIYLLFYEEMSYEEASHVLHKSKKQISNLAYRAKQALRQIIIDKETFEL